MDHAGEMFRCFQLAFHKRLVDDHLCADVRDFTSLPGFDLPWHRFEVSLHSINANRDAVDERERLRVFREHGGKHACDNVAKLKLSGFTCDSFIPGPPALFPMCRTTVSNSQGLKIVRDPASH